MRQVQRSWPEKQDAVAVDPATGEVTGELRFADHPVLAKLTRWGIDLHTGVLFGLANQIALALLALALVLLIVWGYRMWWQRGRGSAFGQPLPRGSWAQVPPYLLVPALAVIAATGYFVPLLGIPLAAFIAVDVVLGEIAHRRGRRTPGNAAGSPGSGTFRGAVAPRNVPRARFHEGTGPVRTAHSRGKSPASAEAIRRCGSASSCRACRWSVRPSISRA